MNFTNFREVFKNNRSILKYSTHLAMRTIKNSQHPSSDKLPRMELHGKFRFIFQKCFDEKKKQKGKKNADRVNEGDVEVAELVRRTSSRSQ